MRDILFMGEILASVTHDMQNIMAIIKESGALAEDIIALNKFTRIKHRDKLDSALCNIKDQVARGRSLMIMLNGFAHAAEDFPGACDLVRFSEQIGVLAARMVRLKECELIYEPYTEPITVRGNALLLMQSVYIGLDSLLGTCSAGDTLTLSIISEKKAKSTTAAVHMRTRNSQTIPKCGLTLATLITELDGQCSVAPGAITLNFQLLDISETGAV